MKLGEVDGKKIGCTVSLLVSHTLYFFFLVLINKTVASLDVDFFILTSFFSEW